MPVPAATRTTATRPRGPLLVRVHVLGGLRVDGFDGREVGSRKARTLLGALAVNGGRPVSADALVDVLWPQRPPRAPREQVGVLVSRLRRTLGADRILRTDAGYVLASDWCDLDELIARAGEATAAVDAHRWPAARAAAGAALALGDAEVLPGDDGRWLDVPRAQAAAAMAAARRAAVSAAMACGDLAVAVTHAEAVLAADPHDEVVTGALMEAQVRSGNPAAALASYARLRRVLAEDLGVSPADDVEALHTAILTGAPLPRPTTGGLPARRAAGRERELEALDHHLASLGDGSAAVVVEGEPGIGKTTLLDAWAARQDPGTVVVLRGRCDPLGRDLPLQPVADALDAGLRMQPDVLRLLDADDRARLAARLGLGAGSTAVDAPMPDLDGAALLYVSIDRLIAALAAGRTAVLLLDDLHHAGASTMAWISFAVRRGRRLLVVGARHVGTAPLPAASVLALGPLDRTAVALLAGADRAEELHQRSGGHPLLLRALLDVEVRGGGSLTEDVSLQDVVERQSDALGAAADVVRRAAVLGPDVDLDLVAAVERRPGGAVLEDLERAVVLGLLDDGPDGLRFRHELVRQGLEAQLSTARRALVHREAAHRLRERTNPDWSVIGYHAACGGQTELAATAYRHASFAAAMRHDLDAAERYLDEAIERSPSADCHRERARVRMSRLDLDGAADDAAQAVALGGGAPASEVAAWVAYYARRYDDAAALADRALASAPDDAVRLSALAVSARVRHGAGDLAGALRLLRDRGDGPAQVRGVADVWHAHALVHAGDMAAALHLADRALASGDGLAQPFAPLHGRFARVMALGHLGRPADALAACDDLDRAIVRFGEQARRFHGPAANVRAWLLRNLGEVDEADEWNRRALDATGDRGRPRSAPLAEGFWVAMLDLADGALVRGADDDAADVLDRCSPISSWTGTMAWHQRHRLELLHARVALADGRAADAADHAAAAVADARRRGARRYVVLGEAVLAIANPDVDPSAAVDHLEDVAGMEAWRYLADIARARHDDRLTQRAHRAARRLLPLTGDHADSFARLAERALGV